MSSFVRRIQRRWAKKLPDYEATTTQQYRQNTDGGYDVLHPTKGWRHVSGKRVK